MVDYDESVYENIKKDYTALAGRLALSDVDFIPVSALRGDNIVHESAHLSWHKGPSLLTYLENIVIEEQQETASWRFPVQWVVRPQTDALHDYRGYAGRVIGAGLQVGEEVVILPSGTRTSIKAIELNQENLLQAENGQSIILHLADDVDVSRGDIITSVNNQPHASRGFSANICWFDTRSLDDSQVYLLQNHTATTKVKIADVAYKYDVNTQEKIFNDTQVHLNDIARISVRAANDVVFDLSSDFPENARAILIDPRTNLTVAAALIETAE